MPANHTDRDRGLFGRIMLGDALAFRELFDLYYPALKMNALKFLKSEYWAEEIAQEVMLHVWDQRSTLGTIENPVAWLYRITSHKCFDRGRRQELELRAQYVIDRVQRQKTDIVQNDHYDYALLQKLIKEAVQLMPEQRRIVYRLQQEEELSYKEIAARLDISPHTVRNHLIKAFQEVRDYVQQHGEFALIAWYMMNEFLRKH